LQKTITNRQFINPNQYISAGGMVVHVPVSQNKFLVIMMKKKYFVVTFGRSISLWII
jgi:hypothetical protein